MGFPVLEKVDVDQPAFHSVTIERRMLTMKLYYLIVNNVC